MGLDSRESTPSLVQRIVYAGGEVPFDRAVLLLKQLGGNEVSAKTIERITRTVGSELVALRDAEIDNAATGCETVEAPPALAVVECDGGRIHTRREGSGPGVHDKQWRETKNACLLRMTHQCFDADPHPELPRAFCDVAKVAKLAEKEPLSVPTRSSESSSEEPPRRADWRPQRIARSCLSSMVDSHAFGFQIESEARRRRFFEAAARAFLGDGLAWNWSIQQTHFPTFIAILDFIHPLHYLYTAASALAAEAEQIWKCYVGMAEACWQGRVDEVIGALAKWLSEEGIDAEHPVKEDDPQQPVVAALRYLTNNRERMDYPRYRRLGLPVTSALMESLVKEVNHRVKGTAKFWNDPSGAEAILQVRAAALCDDDRLARYLTRRPGCPYVRRPDASAV